MAKQTVFINEFTDGVLDPEQQMLGPVADGGHIVANTAPGCWGPMMTPELKGGHEVTRPVYVEGAQVGDAVAIRIKSIDITSGATASGSDEAVEERFVSDPFVDGKCPGCGQLNPESVIEGTGKEAVRCRNCGADVTPFVISHGYTMAFDSDRSVGVTLDKAGAESAARDGRHIMSTPEASVQNPAVSFTPHDLVGTVARIRSFLGQLGTVPSKALPDSHNAGDFGQLLIDAPHEYGLKEEALKHRTDGHLDVNRVRAGAVLVAPVKVNGGGVYLGDMHAMQGNGEIAGHTTDVSGIVNLQVKVIKGLNLDGPILFPVEEDLPYLAKPITEREKTVALEVGKSWGMTEVEDSLPISFVGSGATLNEATDNGMQRAANVLGIPVEEVMNRSTITGSIDVGRHPGVVTVTFLAPVQLLDQTGLTDMIRQQYS